MRKFWIALIAVVIVTAGVSAPRVVSVSASNHNDAAAAKKKCKKGYHRVHSKCTKKRPVAPTPIPSPTVVPGVLQHPDALALDAQGNIYVTEGFLPGTDAGGQAINAESRVLKLSPSGQLLATLATSGSAPGQFLGPNGVALDAQGNIYVADFFNDRIQKLSPTGQPLAAWGAAGTGPGQFDFPVTMAIDAQGNIYVTDRILNRVQKFSPTGQVLAVWDSKEYGFSGNTPWGIAVEAQGNVFVVDHENSRILKLSPTGQVLATFK